MRYSVEMSRDRFGPVIVLRSHPDDWSPEEGQVEVPAELVAQHVDLEKLAACWQWVEFSPRSHVWSYQELAEMLGELDPPLAESSLQGSALAQLAW